jgi:hypothetical protein
MTMAQYDNRYGQVGMGRAESAAYDEGLRSYMLRVYNYMALGVAGTAVVTMFMVNNPELMRVVALGPGKWVLFFAILGLGIFAPRLFYTGSAVMAHGAYWLYCALWGMLISPMIFLFLSKGAAGLIGQAFIVASATFAATSLIGYTTKKDMTGWGNFLSMASIGLIIALLVSFFFVTDPGTSKMLSLGISAVVVLLFSVITAWETQQIKQMYLEGAAGGGQEFTQRSAIFGSFLLYGSFVTLFTHILNILGITSSNE